jgi:rubrerythrin
MKLTCKLCNEVFEDELDMSMHLMYGHHIDGICPICGEPFNLTSATKAEKW